MRFEEWLNEIVPHQEDCLSAPIQVQRRERIAFLVFTNGGFYVRGWGSSTYHNGNRFGLEQNEALELIHYGGVFEGAELAGFDTSKAFLEYLTEYRKQREGNAQTN